MDVQTRGVTRLEDDLVCNFKLTANVVRNGNRKFMYDANRSAILKRDLLGLCVDGNWYICGSETVTTSMDTDSLSQSRNQIYQLPPRHNPTTSLFRIPGLLVSYINFLIPPLRTFVANFKLHTNLSSNHVMLLAYTSVKHPPLHFHPCIQWHLRFSVSFLCSIVDEGHSVT